jgi:hypothetical protein
MLAIRCARQKIGQMETKRIERRKIQETSVQKDLESGVQTKEKNIWGTCRHRAFGLFCCSAALNFCVPSITKATGLSPQHSIALRFQLNR